MQAARKFESQLAESILKGNGQLAFEKLATATLEKLMPRIEGKGEFGQARWKIVYSPQIPSSVSVGSRVDPFGLLANNLSFGTDVEVQLGKRLQVTIRKLVYLLKLLLPPKTGLLILLISSFQQLTSLVLSIEGQ